MTRLHQAARHPFTPLLATFTVWLTGSLTLPPRTGDVWDVVGLIAVAATGLAGYGDLVREDERARHAEAAATARRDAMRDAADTLDRLGRTISAGHEGQIGRLSGYRDGLATASAHLRSRARGEPTGDATEATVTPLPDRTGTP